MTARPSHPASWIAALERLRAAVADTLRAMADALDARGQQ